MKGKGWGREGKGLREGDGKGESEGRKSGREGVDIAWREACSYPRKP